MNLASLKIGLLFLLALPLTAFGILPDSAAFTDSAESSLFRFARPSKIGTRHKFVIRAEDAKSAQLELPQQIRGSQHGAEETYSVKMDGIVETLAVNASGNSTRLRIQINGVEARRNETSIPVSFAGRTLLADLSRNDPVFIREDRVKLTGNEVTLLGLIFRPALKETFNDLLGSDTRMVKDMRWRPPTAAVMRAIQENRIKMTEAELIAAAMATPCNIQGTPCWRVDLKIQTVPTREDIGFTFEIAVILPENSELPALRMRRDCSFMTRQPFSGDELNGHPLPQGAQLVQTSSETMIIDITPIPTKGRP